MLDTSFNISLLHPVTKLYHFQHFSRDTQLDLSDIRGLSNDQIYKIPRILEGKNIRETTGLRDSICHDLQDNLVYFLLYH